MAQIHNPVLTGFNPDPSILRVDSDYYIATSTFEWFPGVQIHHSRDLVHWRLLTRALTRTSQLDLRGDPFSCGVWAPCLSCQDGTFYLVYTDVKQFGIFNNYVVTAASLCGPWSDPVYLNSSGFDPSLFHDPSGGSWLVNMQWDFRKGKNAFSGITLQQYDTARAELCGPVKNIFSGSPLGITEGPHLYKRNRWYYLLTAEGGTGYGHAVTVARSRSIDGPYEISPNNPILTSSGDPSLKLQKAGHGSLVCTPDNQWYMAHLCGRPFAVDTAKDPRRCILGRETAIQKIEWDSDGWPRLSHDGNSPMERVEAPNLPAHPWPQRAERDDFESAQLGIDFQSLRVPFDESWVSLDERPGWLRITARDPLYSCFDQSMVGRRVQSVRAAVTTAVDFEPDTFLQSAGLTVFYSDKGYYYLRITHDQTRGKMLGIVSSVHNQYDELNNSDVTLAPGRLVFLRARIDCPTLQFYYSYDEKGFTPIGPALDMTVLSDEYIGFPAFTGTFAGLCAQDLLFFKEKGLV